MWLRPGDKNGVKVPPYSEDTMLTLMEGTSVISLGLAYRRKTTDYNQKKTPPSTESLSVPVIHDTPLAAAPPRKSLFRNRPS
jgi:hypothetical protein